MRYLLSSNLVRRQPHDVLFKEEGPINPPSSFIQECNFQGGSLRDTLAQTVVEEEFKFGGSLLQFTIAEYPFRSGRVRSKISKGL